MKGPDCALQIFLLDTEEQSRSEADGQAWKEDAQWARILDQEWDLQAVKQVQICGACSYLLLRLVLVAAVFLECCVPALQHMRARGLPQEGSTGIAAHRLESPLRKGSAACWTT